VDWQARISVGPASPEHAALGQAIRQLRLAAGISQEGLAERSGMHRTYVGGIERGERNVSFRNLLRLAGALEVRPSELIERYESCLSAAARPHTRPSDGDRT